MSARKAAYLAYIRSPAWRAFRTSWWAEYDRKHKVRRCYCCGQAQAELTSPLELHHRTYERLGHERYSDLVGVCRPCHRWVTNRQRNKAVAMTIWEITEARRTMMRDYTYKKQGPASGR